MPTRLLHENICVSESLAKCSPKAQDAFPRFMLTADNFGTFQVNAKSLKGRLWPLRDDVKPSDITRFIHEYQRQGMLHLWEAEGKQYAIFSNWSKFQRVYANLHRKYPAPPANLREIAGNCGNLPQIPEVSSSCSSSSNNSSSRSKAGDSEDFETFWKAYPRKVSKTSARKAWDRLAPDPALRGVILAAIARQRESSQWKDHGGKYIPHPTTWLNNHRWTDELEPAISDAERRKREILYGPG